MKYFLAMMMFTSPMFAKEAKELFWSYQTLDSSEFEDVESYLLFKMQESFSLAGHPVNGINSQEDVYKYIYFTGKAVAYYDAMKIISD
jgi:hypothetical protein